MKPTSTNVFLQVAKNTEVTRGKIWLYGGCWSVSQPNLWSLTIIRLAVWGRALSSIRMIPSDSIPRRFDFMARCSTISHQETNHTSLHFFAWLHFQCRMNALYTTLTSRAIKKQLCEPVRLHYECLLPYRWQYRYIKECCQLLLWMCFMAGVRFLCVYTKRLFVLLCSQCFI